VGRLDKLKLITKIVCLRQSIVIGIQIQERSFNSRSESRARSTNSG
jgi:hypothetical protein